jgi:hypothetical protein
MQRAWSRPPDAMQHASDATLVRVDHLPRDSYFVSDF